MYQYDQLHKEKTFSQSIQKGPKTKTPLHRQGNDLSKTIKLMVSMKADVTKPDGSLAAIFF